MTRPPTVFALLLSLPSREWVTVAFPMAQFQGMGNYAARKLLDDLRRKGLVERGEYDAQGRRLYRITGAGRLRAIAIRKRAQEAESHHAGATQSWADRHVDPRRAGRVTTTRPGPAAVRQMIRGGR